MSAASAANEAQLYYIHTDHLGTPQELTDRDGHLQWVGQYRAWGELAKANDSEGNAANVEMPLRFQGQYCDEETGLHYNRFRYYDPQVGRFTTQDPISLAGGLNLYQYAPNPVGYIDPLGLSGLSIAQQQVNAIFKEHLPAIQQIDPNAVIGYRGSLASGVSKAHDPSIARPINLNSFDVDAFIQSDYLAIDPEFRNRRRDANKISGMPEIKASIDKKLRAVSLD